MTWMLKCSPKNWTRSVMDGNITCAWFWTPTPLPLPEYRTRPAAEYFRKNYPTQYARTGDNYAFNTPGYQEAHRLLRLSGQVDVLLVLRVVLASWGPDEPLCLQPYFTDTVRGLRRAGFKDRMPILADALQDAGMDETCWLLDRLRDATTPFVPNEWFHRVMKGLK